MTNVKFKVAPGAALPEYATDGAAGADLRAYLPKDDCVIIHPGTWRLVPTGLDIELPGGFEAQVRPRSGLAIKKGVTVLNAPGTVDADYRGPVGVILVNHSQEIFTVFHGDRIAQLVIAPVTRASFGHVEELSETERGGGGFGSTGSK